MAMRQERLRSSASHTKHTLAQPYVGQAAKGANIITLASAQRVKPSRLSTLWSYSLSVASSPLGDSIIGVVSIGLLVAAMGIISTMLHS